MHNYWIWTITMFVGFLIVLNIISLLAGEEWAWFVICCWPCNGDIASSWKFWTFWPLLPAAVFMTTPLLSSLVFMRSGFLSCSTTKVLSDDRVVVSGDLWNVYDEPLVNGLSPCIILPFWTLFRWHIWHFRMDCAISDNLFSVVRLLCCVLKVVSNWFVCCCCCSAIAWEKKVAWLGDDSSCNRLCHDSFPKPNPEASSEED